MVVIEKVKSIFLGNPSPSTKQIHSLDGIRGFAILFVFFDHAKGQGLELFPVLNPTGFGKAGVYLFFVLSSFLLAGQFLRDDCELRRWSLWVSYALKRVLRIYPLYIFIMLLYGIVPSFKYTATDVFSHIFLQEGKDQFWAIPVEFKFYLFLPILMWLIVKVLKKNLGLSTLFLGAVMSASFLITIEPAEVARVSLIKYLPIFLLGILAALIHAHLQNHQTQFLESDTFGYIAEGVALLSLIATFGLITTLRTKPDWFLLQQDWSDTLIFIAFGGAWSLFLVAQLHGRGLIRGLLSHPIIRFVGTISFSMYLWHMALIGYTNAHLNMAPPIKFSIILTITLGVAIMSFFVIERPFFRLKKYLPR